MRPGRVLAMLAALVVAIALPFAGPSCTDSNLYVPPPPPLSSEARALSIAGRYCTDDPQDFMAPVKIILLVDYSQSMIVSDPTSSRIQAVYELMSRLGKDKALYYALAVFSGETNSVLNSLATPPLPAGDPKVDVGFVSSTQIDFQAVKDQLTTLATTMNGQTTAFHQALSWARLRIEQDILGGDPSVVARTKYAVVLLSDGMPTEDLSATCQMGSPTLTAADYSRCQGSCLPRQVMDDVYQIVRLKDRGAGEVVVHTAYVFNNPTAPPPGPMVTTVATNILYCMSKQGQGDFRDFASGEPVDFLGFDFRSLQRMFGLKTLLVFNASARPDSALPDTDRDGLDDAWELAHGFDPLDPDTDHDGFSDLLEATYPSNFPQPPPDGGHPGCVARVDANGVPQPDLDHDGINDCEEIFVGTSNRSLDTDNDGLPDKVEWVMGTRPSVPDVEGDIDGDKVPNGREVLYHTDPQKDDSANLADTAYRYRIQAEGAPVGGKTCYSFNVDNVLLVPTGESIPGEGPGYNEIEIWADEVPFDAPSAKGIFHVARLRPKLVGEVKDPPGGKMTVAPEDFKVP